MTITDRDREAAQAARAWLTEARAVVGMFDSDAQRIERLVPSLATLLATARAKGRQVGMMEAANIAENAAVSHPTPSGIAGHPYTPAEVRRNIAAVIRASAGEDAGC